MAEFPFISPLINGKSYVFRQKILQLINSGYSWSAEKKD